MEHSEALTRYIAQFIDELAASGCSDVIISPGSRSTPLAVLASEHPELRTWILIDERSAAFFALGSAKEKNRPTALICSSGTAAANYYPAIIEAHYARVPLIILTADRPHELRDVGAPQAIDQIQLYGDYVKWFKEMAPPEDSGSMLSYARSNASRAVFTANAINRGPVHLNFPFREPLVPDLTLKDIWQRPDGRPFHDRIAGKLELQDEALEELVHLLSDKKRGIIVCGPDVPEEDVIPITTLALEWDLPLFADPLSSFRTGMHFKQNIIETYDALLRSSGIRKQAAPDFIIRFGAMPVSKSYLFYTQEHAAVDQFVVEPYEGNRDPSGNSSRFIYADGGILASELMDVGMHLEFDAGWAAMWRDWNETAKNILLTDDRLLTEGSAVKYICEQIPADSCFYIGNSMSIRDADTFMMNMSKKIRTLGNRGANGIDGMVSSGMGAASGGVRVTLLLGDLSLYHDMNGLLAAKQYGLDITIVCINNDGGGIFSFLPQAEESQGFERLFGTPTGIEWKHAAEMYGASYHCPTTVDAFESALEASYAEKGMTIIEVQTDRGENKAWHNEKWEQVRDAIQRESDA